MGKGRFENPVEAVLTGVTDFIRRKPNVRPLAPTDRLDGKTCLITGANSGIGFAVAVEYGRRGANLILACRRDIQDTGARVKALSSAAKIEMLQVDLSDISSIHRFCDDLRDRAIQLDVIVCNAGVTPPRARKTTQGLEEMFTVNYLANFILLNRLLKDGVIPNAVFAGNSRPIGASRPRVLLNSSDSHRGSTAIDVELLGVYEDYGVRKAIQLYGYYKLVLNTFATELSRRLNPDGVVDVSVFPLCPGPVNTNIIRDAPPLLKGFMQFIFSIFFQAPDKATPPFVHLACAPEMEGRTNCYLHMMTEKRMDEKVYDPEIGERLWERSVELGGARGE